MKKIGLFYGTATTKTASVAKKIQAAFDDKVVDLIAIEKAWEKEFEAYDYLIVGSSTWFDGELPNYWDEVIPELGTIQLTNKKVAIFGLGNQKEYPDNFVDAVGLLANAFQSAGATLVGLTSPDGYNFNKSLALKDGKLLGLVLDFENQATLNTERINGWVDQLKKEFVE